MPPALLSSHLLQGHGSLAQPVFMPRAGILEGFLLAVGSHT